MPNTKITGLTARTPTIGDEFPINRGGVDGKLTVGANWPFSDGNGIYDSAGNPLLIFDGIVSAVNYLEITNAATGDGPIIGTQGSDTEGIPLTISYKEPTSKYYPNFGTIPFATFAQIHDFGDSDYPGVLYYSNPTGDAIYDGSGGGFFMTAVDAYHDQGHNYVLTFQGDTKNSSGNWFVAGGMDLISHDATAGAEDSCWNWFVKIAGAGHCPFAVGDGVKVGSLDAYGDIAGGWPGLGSLSVENEIYAGGFTELPEISTPATPAAGRVRIYAKSDHKMYSLGSDAVERALS